MKLILGSSSKYRREVMERAGYIFDVMVPDVDEKAIETPDPRERPIILARAKADALAGKIKEPAILITSDVLVICEGKVCEKPESLDEARQFLKRYGPEVVPEAVCALVVTNTATGQRYEGVISSKVFFKKIPDSVIENFLKEGEPLTRAGGYAVQHPILKPYIERLEVSEETQLGMPLDLLEKLLAQAGRK